MANREITYYSLLSSENLQHIESVADEMNEQSFVTLGFEEKWFPHLWIGANNEAFLEYLSHQTDLKKLDRILEEQLKLYARKKGEGFEQNEEDLNKIFEARKDWLNHTIFICKNEYNKTKNEIFSEAVKWCVDWQNEWLEKFNPSNSNKVDDTRFYLTTFYNRQVQTEPTYQSHLREIQSNGCLIVNSGNNSVKIFNPGLAVILTTEELPAENMDTNEETTINGWDYFKTFIEAYLEGEKYFETEIKVSPDTLYGVNAENYVRDIHMNYFHIRHSGIKEGWVYYKNNCPFILTHRAIKEFGYYSGILSKVEEQVRKYPQIFASFEKCELNSEAREIKNLNLEKPTIETKPNINKETANDVFIILQGYFDTSQHTELSSLLKNGNDSKSKLLFRAQGNKLTDTFKQLYEANLLTGCQKKDLQNWIVSNFQYLNKKQPTDFNYKTVEKNVSSNEYPCKNPIIKIENGKVLRV